MEEVEITPIAHCRQSLEILAAKTQDIMLFYSTGKDSIVLLDLCVKKFKRVVCVYMYFVPNLTHNKYLIDYAISRGAEVMQYPHWMTSNYLSENYYRTWKDDIMPPKIKLGDIENKARIDTGLEWIVTGMKQSDSLNRRLMLRRFENQSIDIKGHRCHPLSIWKNEMCLSYIKMNKLPSPIEYEKGKKSQGMDLNVQFLGFLRTKHPQDYIELLKIFPHAESIE